MMKLVAIRRDKSKTHLRHWKLEEGCDLRIYFGVNNVRAITLEGEILQIDNEESVTIRIYEPDMGPIKWEN